MWDILQNDTTRTLFALSHGEWPDELMLGDLRYVFDAVLAPRERQIVELKVQGYKDVDVLRRMRIKLQTLERYKYGIIKVVANILGMTKY